jgi:hypothetical protein
LGLKLLVQVVAGAGGLCDEVAKGIGDVRRLRVCELGRDKVAKYIGDVRRITCV